jgi:2-polyprenyl-6-hydroxyphenyl methylase/3-demethylubiquinone-9 3-methyltransferase
MVNQVDQNAPQSGEDLGKAIKNSTIDKQEVEKFTAMAAEWWDPKGKFKPLHKFNPTRLAYIRQHVCEIFSLDPTLEQPFTGLSLLDIGCGGGLLSEPMTRLGAKVTGADASDANIKTAKIHAEQQGLAIDYRAETAEQLVAKGETFDIILNMEVIEHVADINLFIGSCSQLLKPNGVMFIATLNRTLKALGLAIIGAEYILGWLPRGTHDWSKFVTPAELDAALSRHGMEMQTSTGVSYNPIFDKWSQTGDLQVNYMGIARPIIS